MALVVSTKQPFLVVNSRREAAEAPNNGISSPRSGRSAEGAKHSSPGQAALKARAALGKAPTKVVFLGLFAPGRRS